MKLAKKMLACVLALAMVAVLGLTAFAAAPVMTLTAGDAVIGKKVTLTVAVSGMAGTESGNLEFTYDSTILEYVDNSAAPSSTDGAVVAAGSPAAGALTCAVMYMNGATADQPTLVTYTFNVLKAGDAAITGKVTSWDGTDAPADASLTINAHEKVTTTAPVSNDPGKVSTTAKEDTTGTKEPTKPSTSIQQTGEAGIAVIAGVMAIAAVAFVATKKKDEE